MTRRIPLTLLTGFLGSGKTTLLNVLLAQRAMSGTLVIINEFGSIGLDHLLVTHAEEELVVELSGGCMCCTRRGDLVRTLRDLQTRLAPEGERIRRIVVETTGMADPAPVVHTLAGDPYLAAHYRLDGIVATVDAVNGAATFDEHDQAIRQAAFADCIVLTKTDLATPAQVGALTARLDAINPGAARTVTVDGKIDARQLLAQARFLPGSKPEAVGRWLNEAAYARVPARAADLPWAGKRGHAAGADGRHDNGIRAFCFAADAPLDRKRFDTWLGALTMLLGESLLRVKGILNIAGSDRPLVFHAVQHLLHPPVRLEAWPSEDRRSRLVFITRRIPRGTIERSFASLVGGAPGEPADDQE